MAAALLTLMCLAAAPSYPTPISNDFSAVLKVTIAGITYDGSMQVDTSGRRTSQYLSGLEQTTIVVQPMNRAIVHTYIVVPTQPNPSCTCSSQMSSDISDPWFYYMRGTSNGTSCTGEHSKKTGKLFTIDSNIYQSPSGSLCQADDGTPIFTSLAYETREYMSFTKGRTELNMTALDTFLPGCSSGCSHDY